MVDAGKADGRKQSSECLEGLLAACVGRPRFGPWLVTSSICQPRPVELAYRYTRVLIKYRSFD